MSNTLINKKSIHFFSSYSTTLTAVISVFNQVSISTIQQYRISGSLSCLETKKKTN